MKIPYAITAGICCLALASCEVEFDFSGLDDKPLFLIDGHLQADPFNPEYGDFQMYLYAVPSAAGEREFSEEARCTLKVYKNSELIDTKDYITIESFYGLIADNYNIVAGDEITVTAESDGFTVASAKTVVPRNPPEIEASCTQEGDNLKIRFSFEDNADTEDAYALCFRAVTTSSRPDDMDTGGQSLELPSGNSSGSYFHNAGRFDVTWEDGYRYYGIFDDSFNGQRKEYEVTVPFFPTGNGNSYLRIEIQHISPERLRYEIACIDKGSNVLGFIGLSPVTFAYTNVSGGAGCLSSGNTGYTEWIEIP